MHVNFLRHWVNMNVCKWDLDFKKKLNAIMYLCDVVVGLPFGSKGSLWTVYSRLLQNKIYTYIYLYVYIFKMLLEDNLLCPF